jgi:hypothetical protein
LTTSRQLSDALTKVAGAATFDRVWVSQPNHALPGSKTERKPDLLLVPKVYADHPEWSRVLALGEITTSLKFTAKMKRQLIAKAFLVFQTQPDRRYVISISFARTDCRFSIFDRAGVIHSLRSCINDSPLMFLRVLAGLYITLPTTLGFDPTIQRGPDGPMTIAVNDIVYYIKDTLFVSNILRGRGTVCWLVQDEAGKMFVIKDSWANGSRRHTEAEFLQLAQDVEGLAKMVDQQLLTINGRPDSTDDRRAGLELTSSADAIYEKLEVRIHYRIVLTPVGDPLHNFSSREELILSMIDITQSAFSIGVSLRITNIFVCQLTEFSSTKRMYFTVTSVPTISYFSVVGRRTVCPEKVF